MLPSDVDATREAAAARPRARAAHAPPSPFACKWELGRADGAWIEVAGELDLATSPQLRQALQEAQAHARLLALDLRALTFMDTSGVHAILDAAAAAERRQGRLILVCEQGAAERVLKLTAADDQVQIVELVPRERGASKLFSIAPVQAVGRTGTRVRHPIQRNDAMTDKNVDEGKGRLKEAAGSLTDNDGLRREGKADQAKATLKDKVDKAADKAKDLLDRDR